MARTADSTAPSTDGTASELPSGTTPALILSVLADGPLHGYGLAKEIERRSNGFFTGSWGSLYPALQRLEQEGLIEGSWEPHPPQGKRRRRVYRLTPKGESAARHTAGRWRQFAQRILQVLGQVEEPQVATAGITQAKR
ncbi:MAG: helix-turn-helix transcriptional regulator [Chloroflexi bacterium]|nr:helix-turn-helix transcriptional regulator [Chloroflexota bacterium]